MSLAGRCMDCRFCIMENGDYYCSVNDRHVSVKDAGKMNRCDQFVIGTGAQARYCAVNCGHSRQSGHHGDEKDVKQSPPGL